MLSESVSKNLVDLLHHLQSCSGTTEEHEIALVSAAMRKVEVATLSEVISWLDECQGDMDLLHWKLKDACKP
jgi:hypothetical protein